jgi:1-deoxy-D-xylulose-5-phosphate reductoisomerase
VHTITILGSTGSIGRQTLDVVSRHFDRFRVIHLAAGGNVELAQEQIQRFQPTSFVIADASKIDALRQVTSVPVESGEEALCRIA